LVDFLAKLLAQSAMRKDKNQYFFCNFAEKTEMFKIGFLFHLPSNGRNHYDLVLGYDDNRFRLFFVEWKLLPWNYWDMTSHYYDLSFPVIFTNCGDYITDIIFFHEIGNATIKAELKSKYDAYSIEQDEHSIPYIAYKGKSIFNETNASSQEYRLANLLTSRFILARELSLLLADSKKISGKDRYSEHIWKRVIKNYENYLNSIDIEDIISSLYVNVWDVHIPKVGGDDRYYVYREAKLLDGREISDEYLKDLIGLGKVCIEKDSGYTSYFPRPNIPFGVYEGQILEEEKERIINKYSRSEHMGWLMYHQLFKQEESKSKIEYLQKEIKKISGELNSDFHLDVVSTFDERHFYDFGKSYLNQSDVITKANEYISKKFSQLPRLAVVISGKIAKSDETIAYKKIAEIFDYLQTKYFVVLITGNANGAESIALKVAYDKSIEFVNEYTNWTMLNKDRCQNRFEQMAELSDMIILFGDNDYYLRDIQLMAMRKGTAKV